MPSTRNIGAIQNVVVKIFLLIKYTFDLTIIIRFVFMQVNN